MRRVLVCSDLSARADRAVERALDLARRWNAAVTVMHVIDDDLPLAAADALKTAAGDALSTLMARLDPDERACASVRVVTGQVFAAIVDQARTDGAELIVLGSHRNEACPLPIVGSTMERVIHESAQPVLVVKGAAGVPYRRALVAVDFSEFSRAALRAALRLVPEGAIHVVHVYHVPFQGFLSDGTARKELRCCHAREVKGLIAEQMEVLLAERHGCTASAVQLRPHLFEGEVHATLRRQVAALDADLLVLGTHGRTGLARAWLGSIAEDFLVRPPCDVLVAKVC